MKMQPSTLPANGGQKLWIISKGRHIHWQPSKSAAISGNGMALAYDISPLARFMIDPRPVKVKRRLVGCELTYRQPLRTRLGRRFSHLLPSAVKRWTEKHAIAAETLFSNADADCPEMANVHLENHLKRLESQLGAFNPLRQQLMSLDRSCLETVTGLCDDPCGKPLRLRFGGSIDDNIDYLGAHLQTEVSVVLDQTYAAPGLFELRGLALDGDSLQSPCRLVKCSLNNQPAACVLTPDEQVDFWLENPKRINYLHLLELAVRSNRQFQQALERCRQGESRLLRVFFNRQPIVDYSATNFPETYREVIASFQLAHEAKDNLVNSLNHLQLGISLQTVSEGEAGEKQLDTHVSVMHNFRALEPIRAHLPQLYAAIDKRAVVSEAGKFCLLDTLQGSLNEQ